MWQSTIGCANSVPSASTTSATSPSVAQHPEMATTPSDELIELTDDLIALVSHVRTISRVNAHGERHTVCH